jgi:hypothetical protein
VTVLKTNAEEEVENEIIETKAKKPNAEILLQNKLKIYKPYNTQHVASAIYGPKMETS